MPVGFKCNEFIIRKIYDNSSISYNTVESSGCSNIKFKEYAFLSENKNNKKIMIPLTDSRSKVGPVYRPILYTATGMTEV